MVTTQWREQVTQWMLCFLHVNSSQDGFQNFRTWAPNLIGCGKVCPKHILSTSVPVSSILMIVAPVFGSWAIDVSSKIFLKKGLFMPALYHIHIHCPVYPWTLCASGGHLQKEQMGGNHISLRKTWRHINPRAAHAVAITLCLLSVIKLAVQPVSQLRALHCPGYAAFI